MVTTEGLLVILNLILEQHLVRLYLIIVGNRLVGNLVLSCSRILCLLLLLLLSAFLGLCVAWRIVLR